MRVISGTEPLLVQCPSCWRPMVLRHAEHPPWVDLAAAMRGEVLDVGEPTGIQVALALHARSCNPQLPPDPSPDQPDPETQP